MSRRYPVDQRIIVAGHIPFGAPDSNARFGRHAGDDSANSKGTPVYAPTTGVVTGYTGNQFHGTTVEIFDGKDYPHIFHLNSRLVKPGDKVTIGQQIGTVGSTGLSTGAHSHFGVSNVSVANVTSFANFKDPLAWVKEGEMQPANFMIARVYAQEMLFRDMGEDEYNKFHKGKNRDQLFDTLRDAPEREAYLKDLRDWKARGIALQSENADLLKRIKELEGAATELTPGTYLVK